MKKKIKSAVISIAVIAVLLLSILIGVKNGTLDKLTKEMPTLETKQEKGIDKRLVDNINDLKEKIMIADNHLDDRVIEIIKNHVY